MHQVLVLVQRSRPRDLPTVEPSAHYQCGRSWARSRALATLETAIAVELPVLTHQTVTGW